MFARLIKQTIQKLTSYEQNSTYAMAGIQLKDSTITPEIDSSLSAAEKAERMLGEMTLEEKVDMLGGIDNLAIKGNDRLNLPKVWCSDASAGVRCFKRATAFPVPVAMAATWSREQMRVIGETIGKECRAKGVSILLGPGVNIYRIPTCGRNFEYLGEDPFLASEMAVPYIQGVQRMGVITTVKHFACNNSEYDRHRLNSVVDERTLREIYLPAFKAAVQKAGSLAVMNAYNPVNGAFASENHTLLTRILRKEWGFKGFVISDWTSVYHTERALKAGLDLEMPKADYFRFKRIHKLIKKGRLVETDIDRPVRNLLTTFFKMGIYHRPLKDHRYPEFSAEHSNLSLAAAREAIVLLKNEKNLLPLDKGKVSRIAVVGKMANETTTCGGGSCCIRSYDKISILDGLKNEAGKDTEIVYVEAGKGQLAKQDQQNIKAADAVVVAVGFTNVDESESYDKSWELPDHQGKLISTVASLNTNLIVTLTTGTGVETESWLNRVPALLHCFYLGEKGGQAVAEVLFGSVNPSGKLPFTMAKRWDDFMTTGYYVKNQDKISLLRILGPQGNPHLRKIRDMEYGEKLMVGYRHFDTNRIVPQFPFGFGLSYTCFELSALTLSARDVSLSDISAGSAVEATVTVVNTGRMIGAEVIQLYINDVDASLPRPEKELKGFAKTTLSPGESQTISFTIKSEHLAFFNDKTGEWMVEPGEFWVLIGTSSRDIPLQESLTVH